MDSYARKLFTSAALFNWIAGTPLLVAAPLAARLLNLQPAPTELLFVHFGMVLVLAFGYGYWQVSRDPAGNRGIVRMGIVGKLAVVAVGYGHFLAGNINWPFPALVTVDLIYALLFIDYLKKSGGTR